MVLPFEKMLQCSNYDSNSGFVPVPMRKRTRLVVVAYSQSGDTME
jgi:hypothetical protein